MKTQFEVIKQGYEALINNLGVADTIRFIQYFSPGKGDYTKDRHQWLDNKSREDVQKEMALYKEDNLSQYEEIIE